MPALDETFGGVRARDRPRCQQRPKSGIIFAAAKEASDATGIARTVPEMRGSFVLLLDQRRLTILASLDPDRDWREFVTTTSAWILQTHLRLKAAGNDVELRDSLPESGIVVIGAGDYREVRRRRWHSAGVLIAVAMGSHRGAPPFADTIIVQNPAEADGARSFFMARWPKPGLMPRDPARATRIESAAFKGFPSSLDSAFQGAEWLEFLREQRIEWMCDAVPYADLRTDASGLQFPDYRSVDLIVAVRPESSTTYRDRPATKLVNAWLAGVPAILGPELAYRALRKGPLDYLEVANVTEARAAVIKLLREPEPHRAMVENGIRRAAEFTPARIVHLWQELLFDRLAQLAREPGVKFWLGRPL